MTGRRRSRAIAAACLVGAILASDRAGAFTIQSVVSEGCHERITSEALRRVRADLDVEPIDPDDEETALIRDLQFDPEDDMLDLAGVTLLLGVRDNDLKGRGADDLTNLAHVHGDPANQDEHCLRAADQDEPDGSSEAVAACRAFIERRVGEALDGLGDGGMPDPDQRTELAVHLAIRGDVEAELPTFYVRMGQALHALEDSFSHTYRRGKRVTVALNWIDVIGGVHEESRDGPGHAADLDHCDDGDALRTQRRELATDAAEAILRAALAPGQTREDRMSGVRAVLDEYLGFEPGCTPDNAWCDAPEAIYSTSACACDVPGSGGRGGASFALAMGALVGVLLRRKRRRAAQLVALLGALSATTYAGAQEAPAGELPPEVPPPPPPLEPPRPPAPPPPPAPKVVREPGPANPNAIAFGGGLMAAGAVDKPGLAFGGGFRVRLHKNWALGLDAEWNPFISVTGGEPVRSGTVNVYASVFLRFPLAFEKINLRSSVSAGSSTLVTDLYGAPTGTTGVFLGANFLGLEYKASSIFYFIVNPIGLAIPIPQLEGVPFLYPQYRLSMGLEFYGR